MPYVSKSKLKQLEKQRLKEATLPNTDPINLTPGKTIIFPSDASIVNTDLKDLINGMSEIVGAVKDISVRLSKIENEVSLPKEAPKQQDNTAQITEDSVYPMPIEYKKSVEDKFNKKFGVKVEPNGVLPSFRFTILVPREYSPLNDDEWAMHNSQDPRMKVITMSEGYNGVLQWIEKVWNNLNVETRAKIQADRFNL